MNNNKKIKYENESYKLNNDSKEEDGGDLTHKTFKKNNNNSCNNSCNNNCNNNCNKSCNNSDHNDKNNLFLKIFRNIYIKRIIFKYNRKVNKSLVNISLDDNNIELFLEYSKSVSNINKIDASITNKEIYQSFIESLPSGLKTLSINSFSKVNKEWNQPNSFPELKADQLPDSLTELVLPWYKYSFGISGYSFARNFIKLDLDQFNQTIESNLFPPLLEVLKIPNFNQKIKAFTLPQTLTELVIGGYNSLYDCITYGSIPNKVRTLKFISGISCDSVLNKRGAISMIWNQTQNESFDNQDTGSIFPSCLTDLSIGVKFPYEKIYIGFIPSTVLNLKLSSEVALKNIIWISSILSLQELSFSIGSINYVTQNTFQSLDLKSLVVSTKEFVSNKEIGKRFLSFIPDSVTDLTINGNINFSDSNNKFPNSLSKITIENNSFKFNATKSSSLKSTTSISNISCFILPPNSNYFKHLPHDSKDNNIKFPDIDKLNLEVNSNMSHSLGHYLKKLKTRIKSNH